MQILLADSQPKVRYALRALLEQRPGIRVVGEAGEADELLSQAEQFCPDLVLQDWGLIGQPPADLVAALRRQCPRMVIVVLSGRPEVRGAALAAGADQFVSKADPPESLLSALEGCAVDCDGSGGARGTGR
jgi:two-component system nitrate/nitrite response regulator NarL